MEVKGSCIEALPAEILFEVLLISVAEVAQATSVCEIMINLNLTSRRMHHLVNSDEFTMILLQRTRTSRPPIEALLVYNRLALRKKVLQGLYMASLPHMGCYTLEKLFSVLQRRSVGNTGYMRAFNHLLTNVLHDFPDFSFPSTGHGAEDALRSAILLDELDEDENYTRAKTRLAIDGTPFTALQSSISVGFLSPGFWTIFGPTMTAPEVISVFSSEDSFVEIETLQKVSRVLQKSLQPSVHAALDHASGPLLQYFMSLATFHLKRTWMMILFPKVEFPFGDQEKQGLALKWLDSRLPLLFHAIRKGWITGQQIEHKASALAILFQLHPDEIDGVLTELDLSQQFLLAIGTN